MARVARGDSAYSLIPVFPSRSVRHSAFFIRTDRGIARPEDLVGRTVGVREYTMTAALVARGMLQDEYGVTAKDVRWLVGDVDERERDAIALPALPDAFELAAVAEDKLPSHLTAAGDIHRRLA